MQPNLRSLLPGRHISHQHQRQPFLGWFITTIRARADFSETLALAISIGFVGGYTMFSTFAYESNALLENGAAMRALANMIGSLIFGLLAVRLGIWVASR